jgi:hypothetical protein
MFDPRPNRLANVWAMLTRLVARPAPSQRFIERVEAAGRGRSAAWRGLPVDPT